MKKFLLVIPLCMLFSFPAFAQEEAPGFQIFGGYTITYDDDREEVQHGFIAALERKVTDIFGIVGEFSYHDADEAPNYTFLGGPRISYITKDSFRPFAHLLIGGTYFDYVFRDTNETVLSIVYGGGVDYALTELFTIRPIQFDVLSVHVDDEMATSFRVSGGAILTF